MEILIKAPRNIDCGMKEWPAQYVVRSAGDARLVRIKARSSIDVIVTKITEEGHQGPQANYYVASPNFGVAIPGIPSLTDTFWISEQLLVHEMPAPDAVTVSQILQDIGDF